MQQRSKLIICLGVEFSLVVVVASLGDLRGHVPVFLVLFALASISFVLAVQLLRNLRIPFWAMLLVALSLRLPLFFTQPSLSDDVWRYVHDGRAQLAGVNPFSYPPQHPATQSFRGPEFERINHSELPTIYPPIAQFAFRLIAATPRPLFTWRLLLLAAELAMVLSAAALLRRRGIPQNNLALYAWHPLAMIETIGSAHVDMLGVTLLVASLLFMERGGQVKAGFLLAASVGAKLVAAPLALFAARSYRFALAFVVLLALSYAPFLSNAPNVFGSLGVFAERWESNGSLHAIFAPLIGQNIYRLCAAALLLVGLAALRIKAIDVIDAAAIYFLALFALAPVVHPWYLLWVLALLPLRERPFDALGSAALFWSVSVVLAYSAIQQQQANGQWRVPPLLLFLQYAPCYFLVIKAISPKVVPAYARFTVLQRSR